MGSPEAPFPRRQMRVSKGAINRRNPSSQCHRKMRAGWGGGVGGEGAARNEQRHGCIQIAKKTKILKDLSNIGSFNKGKVK